MRLSIEPLYAVFSRLRLTATPTTADLGCYSRAPDPRRPGIATGRKHAATADAKREQCERSQRSDRRDINANLSAATITTRRRRPSEGFASPSAWEWAPKSFFRSMRVHPRRLTLRRWLLLRRHSRSRQCVPRSKRMIPGWQSCGTSSKPSSRCHSALGALSVVLRGLRRLLRRRRHRGCATALLRRAGGDRVAARRQPVAKRASRGADRVGRLTGSRSSRRARCTCSRGACGWKPHHDHAQGKTSTGVFVLRGRVTHPKAQRNDAVTAITLSGTKSVSSLWLSADTAVRFGKSTLSTRRRLVAWMLSASRSTGRATRSNCNTRGSFRRSFASSREGSMRAISPRSSAAQGWTPRNGSTVPYHSLIALTAGRPKIEPMQSG
jgi:hypothetical protein